MGNFSTISDAEREELIANLIDELPVLRLKIGLSQDDLSKMLGISRQTFSSIETKKRKMSWSLFLSLILIFYHNEVTRDYIYNAGLIPTKLMQSTDAKGNTTISSFVQFENDDIINHLDEQAIHAIETVIMMEYARCNNMTGDAVIRVFDGQRSTQVTKHGEIEEAIKKEKSNSG